MKKDDGIVGEPKQQQSSRLFVWQKSENPLPILVFKEKEKKRGMLLAKARLLLTFVPIF